MIEKAITKSGPTTAERTYHHGNLRAAALEAALEALARKMPSEISLRELAKTIGVGHSALYAHFSDRDELFAVVSAQGFETLKRGMEDALSGADDKPSSLACAYLAFARENPAHYRAMFRASNIRGAVADTIDDACNGCLDLMVDAIVARTGLLGEEARRRAVGVWCALHGLVLLADRTGPLRHMVSAQEEMVMARDYTRALISG